MGRLIILFIVFLISLEAAFSIGMFSPPEDKFIFEPNMEKEIGYTAINNAGRKMDITLSVNGDLSEYFSLSIDVLRNMESGQSGSFMVSMNLPETITPGLHTVYIGALEGSDTGGALGARGEVRVPIYIRANYPGKYIEASLSSTDVQLGNDAKFWLSVSNYGTEQIRKLSAAVAIYDLNGKKLRTAYTEEKSVDVNQAESLYAELNTKGFEKGKYRAIATVFYDELNMTTNEAYFNIGDISLLITNYTNEAYAEQVNQFDVWVKSEWNNLIPGVFAEVRIIQNGSAVGYFKTPSSDVNAWEEKAITGYWNTAGVKTGNYNANITIYYADKTTEISGKVEVIKKEQPSAADNTTLLLIGVVILLALLNLFWFMYFRRSQER